MKILYFRKTMPLGSYHLRMDIFYIVECRLALSRYISWSPEEGIDEGELEIVSDPEILGPLERGLDAMENGDDSLIKKIEFDYDDSKIDLLVKGALSSPRQINSPEENDFLRHVSSL